MQRFLEWVELFFVIKKQLQCGKMRLILACLFKTKYDPTWWFLFANHDDIFPEHCNVITVSNTIFEMIGQPKKQLELSVYGLEL